MSDYIGVVWGALPKVEKDRIEAAKNEDREIKCLCECLCGECSTYWRRIYADENLCRDNAYAIADEIPIAPEGYDLDGYVKQKLDIHKVQWVLTEYGAHKSDDMFYVNLHEKYYILIPKEPT